MNILAPCVCDAEASCQCVKWFKRVSPHVQAVQATEAGLASACILQAPALSSLLRALFAMLMARSLLICVMGFAG